MVCLDPSLPRDFSSHYRYSSAVQARLNFYVGKLPHAFEHRKITLHGLRNKCAISLAMAGADIPTVMDHIEWKTPSMPCHNKELNQDLGSGRAGVLLSLLPTIQSKMTYWD